MRNLALVVLTVICSLPVENPCVSVNAKSRLYLGILEDFGKDWDGSDITPKARVVFCKDNDAWVSMKDRVENEEELKRVGGHFPSTIDWNVVFDGKRIGSLVSKSARITTCKDIGRQAIISPSFPKVLFDRERFANWLCVPISRPLVLTSGVTCDDPDRWKPTVLSQAERSAAILEFRKKVQKADVCTGSSSAPKAIRFSDAAVVFEKSYRSRGDGVLMGLHVDRRLYECDGPFPVGSGYDTHWFAASDDHGFSFLGIGLVPLDAADFDSDGASEWIFAIIGYAEDGYMISYKNFSGSARFLWRYH